MNSPLELTDDDRDIAVRTIYGEARGEPFDGQVAVAYVIRNRATWNPPSWWGHSVHEVCRKPFQFSCHNASDPNCKIVSALSSDNLLYVTLLHGVVDPVMAGQIEDPTNGATHYKVIGTKASWDQSVMDINPVVIGHHEFFKLGPNA